MGDDIFGVAFWRRLLRTDGILIWFFVAVVLWNAVRLQSPSAWLMFAALLLFALTVVHEWLLTEAGEVNEDRLGPARRILGIPLYLDRGDVRWLILIRFAMRLPLAFVTVDPSGDAIQRYVLDGGGRVLGARMDGGKVTYRRDDVLAVADEFFDRE